MDGYCTNKNNNVRKTWLWRSAWIQYAIKIMAVKIIVIVMIMISLVRWHSSQWERGGQWESHSHNLRTQQEKGDIPTFWKQIARENRPISSSSSAQTVCCTPEKVAGACAGGTRGLTRGQVSLLEMRNGLLVFCEGTSPKRTMEHNLQIPNTKDQNGLKVI